MLEGVRLSMQGAAGVGGALSCLAVAGGLVALGTEAGSTLLFSEANLVKPFLELPGRRGSVTALNFSTEGGVLYVGARDGSLVRLELGERQSAQQEIRLEPSSSGVTCIQRQEDADLFAVAARRHIYVLDVKGELVSRLGPLPQDVGQLCWLRGGTLVGSSRGALHTWPANGTQLGPVLRTSASSPYLLLAPSPDSRFVAASCTGLEVHCWELQRALQGAAHLQPLRLQEFEGQVACLGWDPSGRFLATADGPDCTIWDLSEPSGAKKQNSTVCCGHEPRTRISCLAFQPEGPMLATASDAGKVVLFDIEHMRRGGVVGPAAFTRLDSHGNEPVSVLQWLRGGRLLAGTASGRIVCYELLPSGGGLQKQELMGKLAALQLVPGASPINGTTTHRPNTPGASAKSAPLQPPVALPAAAALEPQPRGALEQQDGPAVSNGTQQQHYMQQRYARPGSAELPPSGAAQHPPRQLAEEQHQRYSSPPLEPASSGTLEDFSPAPRGRGLQNGSGQASRRGGRGSGLTRSASGRSGSTTSSGPRGVGSPAGGPTISSSLMQHIQQIRENPQMSRNEQQLPLAGWGLGSPGGAPIPWLLSSFGGVPPSPAMAPGGTYPPGSYAHYPAMMMQQRMGQMPPGAVPMPYMAAQMPAAGSPRGYAGMAPPGAGGPQFMPTQWMPYMQQQVQQWAGAAPGYMRYQHTQYSLSSMQQQAMGVHVGSPTAPTGAARKSGGRATSSERDTAENNDSGAAGSGGDSDGSESPCSPAASAAQRRREADASRATAAKAPTRGRTGSAHTPTAVADAAHSNGAVSAATVSEHGGCERSSSELQTLAAAEGQPLPLPSALPPAEESAMQPIPSPRQLGGVSSAEVSSALEAAAWSDLNNKPPCCSDTSSVPDTPTAVPAGDAVNTVYVGNLPTSVDEYVLACTFVHFGPITNVQVIREKGTHVSKGYGFVTFAHPVYATVAMQNMNHQVLFGPFAGQRIKVAPSHKRL